ncbi:GTP-binding protein [Flavihumibacter sp. CACIAM 22H1]|uniref:GTP-binding protein n=1 Tax=Flavihumibacter sp. CACIAM 22H1 TaxID=1812911 RepID=UPI0007A80EBD|nr:GTP-binding protein [Flavihumibacter sp. CACIAM 22H1]KYP16603.1 MAG: hypothetical protein A1D16_09315 [Flavihumibacter sp. CACIAM 22H1]
MKLVFLYGGTGAGKTTAIARVASVLFKERKLFKILINRKSGYSVDYTYFQQQELDVSSYPHACISCAITGFADLLTAVLQQQQYDFVLVEIEQCCKDIQIGVIQPLLKRFPGLSIGAFQFQDARSVYEQLNKGTYILKLKRAVESLSHLNRHRYIVLTKKDLLTTGQLNRLQYLLAQQFPENQVLLQNSHIESDICDWLNAINRRDTEQNSDVFSENYLLLGEDRSAGWYEAGFEFNGPEAGRAVRLFIQRFNRRVIRKEFVTEHTKVLVYTGNTVEKISFSWGDIPISFPRFTSGMQSVKVLINSRNNGVANSLGRIIERILSKIETSLEVVITALPARENGPEFLCQVYKAENYVS